MKRNSLTTAVVAGIAGTVGIANLASAVNLNPDGLGQVLIYPYYTVNEGVAGNNLSTMFSVVNTTDQGKAVKVRFVEGYNSREVRDFHLYLSPFDVWTASVFALPGEAQANLITNDESCTVPAIKNAAVGGPIGALADGRKYVKFTNSLFTGSRKDGGPEGLARTREGHFEMIEMGTVVNAVGGKDSLDAITHIAGVPDNCPQVVAAWTGAPRPGYWSVDASIDIETPTGGLFGSAMLIDVVNGVSAPYSADAIDGFMSAGILHNLPGDTKPSLIDVGGPGALDVTAYVFNNGQLITSSYGAAAPGTRKVDAVSAIFMHNDIFNEYVLDGAANATTDWVVTFPTKRFYVDTAIVGAAPTAAQMAPFVEIFKNYTTVAENGQSKIEVGLFPFDREEASPGACTGSDVDNPNCGVCFSPCDESSTSVPVLRYEAQVISFQSEADFTADKTSPVLGSKLASNVDVRADSLSQGWMRIALNPTTQPHALNASAEGNVFHGLPVTGFAATNYVNADAAPGKLANYSGLWRHKGSRECVNGTGSVACS